MRVLIPAALILATLLFTPAQSGSDTGSSPAESAIRAARTTADLQRLGGTRLGAMGFARKVVGHELDEGNWIWMIRPDGVASKSADDASWTYEGTWKMKQHRYCQKMRTGEQCSEVWMVGPFLRMTGKGDALSDWTVRVK